MEFDGKYYCPGNVIIDGGEIHKLEPEKKLLIDNFIIDLEHRTIKAFGEREGYVYKDSFINAFDKGIEKIEIVKDKESKEGERIIKIKVKDQESIVEIRIDKDNQIIGYKNEELREVGNDFLRHNQGLQTLDLPNLRSVGDYFLYYNQSLQTLNLPNLQSVEDGFLFYNQSLQTLNLPNLQSVGYYFLLYNQGLQTLNLLNLRSADGHFLNSNQDLQTLNLPNLRSVGRCFLYHNQGLQTLNLPNLRSVGTDFLFYNEGLRILDLPNLQSIDEKFLLNNLNAEVNFPNLREASKVQNSVIRNLAEKVIAQNQKGIAKTGDSHLTSKDLATLDKNNKMTSKSITSATSFIHKIVSKIKDFIKRGDRD